jgi:hypothetical protein
MRHELIGIDKKSNHSFIHSFNGRKKPGEKQEEADE